MALHCIHAFMTKIEIWSQAIKLAHSIIDEISLVVTPLQFKVTFALYYVLFESNGPLCSFKNHLSWLKPIENPKTLFNVIMFWYKKSGFNFLFFFNLYFIMNIPIEIQNFYRGVLAKIAAQKFSHKKNK